MPSQPGAPAAAVTPPGALEAMRRNLLELLSALPQRRDSEHAGDGLRQQLKAYEAVTAELDRLDPKGAIARKAESRTLLEQLGAGPRVQIGEQPPTAAQRER